MKFYLDHEIPNWNSYINAERLNKFKAANIKKREMKIIGFLTKGKRYEGKYPVKLIITKYFKDRRQDLDNLNTKILIDGLVKSKVIKNDNLNCITDIELHAKIDKTKEGIEISIEEAN